MSIFKGFGNRAECSDAAPIKDDDSPVDGATSEDRRFVTVLTAEVPSSTHRYVGVYDTPPPDPTFASVFKRRLTVSGTAHLAEGVEHTFEWAECQLFLTRLAGAVLLSTRSKTVEKLHFKLVEVINPPEPSFGGHATTRVVTTTVDDDYLLSLDCDKIYRLSLLQDAAESRCAAAVMFFEVVNVGSKYAVRDVATERCPVAY